MDKGEQAIDRASDSLFTLWAPVVYIEWVMHYVAIYAISLDTVRDEQAMERTSFGDEGPSPQGRTSFDQLLGNQDTDEMPKQGDNEEEQVTTYVWMVALCASISGLMFGESSGASRGVRFKLARMVRGGDVVFEIYDGVGKRSRAGGRNV